MGKILARYVHETLLNTHQIVPGKLFFHGIGSEAFGRNLEEQVEEAGAYAKRVFTPDCYFLVEEAFTLGIIWGHERHKLIDLFIYGSMDQISFDKWKNSNPDADIAWCGNGVWRKSPFFGGATCEDSSIILGREAVHRRKTESLEEYMNSHAHLIDMEPSEPYQNLRI